MSGTLFTVCCMLFPFFFTSHSWSYEVGDRERARERETGRRASIISVLFLLWWRYGRYKTEWVGEHTNSSRHCCVVRVYMLLFYETRYAVYTSIQWPRIKWWNTPFGPRNLVFVHTSAMNGKKSNCADGSCQPMCFECFCIAAHVRETAFAYT